MAEGLRALCAQCQKPLCGPILASGCNHVCLGIGGTGGTDLATRCGPPGGSVHLRFHKACFVAGASCHRCGETLREPLRHLEGSCRWELDSQTHYSI